MVLKVLADITAWVPNSLTLFTLGIIVLTALGAFLFKRYKFIRHCEKIPGPPTEIPLWGGGMALAVNPDGDLAYSSHFYFVLQIH